MSWVVTVSHCALCCHQETLLLLAGCWSWQPSLTAYKASPGKPQAFGDEVPSKYGWHPIVHLLQDLQAASLNSQHLTAHKTSLYKASHTEMPRKPLLGNQWVLYQWLWYWESTSDSLFQQFTSSAACHWDLVPGIWLASHPSTLWPQKMTSYAVEKSRPYLTDISFPKFILLGWTGGLATFFRKTSQIL